MRSTLPQVSSVLTRQVAGGQRERSAAGSLFPRRIHAAAADRRTGASECTRDLHPAVPRRIGNTAHDCGRSQTSGRGTRLLRHPPHLGPEPSLPSPSPLRDSRRRTLARPLALGRFQARLLPARQSALPIVPPPLSRSSPKSFRPKSTPVLRRDRKLPRTPE